MSPKERANRLFDRVMTLAEAGKQDSVQFFLPMALGAYGQLPTLDADAHYDVGLLQLAGGDPVAALAEADTIQRAVPNHLFIYVLRATPTRSRATQPRSNGPTPTSSATSRRNWRSNAPSTTTTADR